jgi:transcriptional regulator with XRE-family HTH domain
MVLQVAQTLRIRQQEIVKDSSRRAILLLFPRYSSNQLAYIAKCDIIIAICDMKLSDKIRYLREVEGSLRGLDRAMTQQELVRAIQESNKVSPGSRKAGATISQSYLSQIESGARPHLTNTTRLLLAKFFQVHPGYLVDDPEGYNAQLLSDIHTLEDKLDLWLIGGAERFRRDPDLCQALLTLAQNKDSRRCLLLLEAVLDTPSLVDRLLQVLRPEAGTSHPVKPASASTTQHKLIPSSNPSKRGKQ